jgi:hypothetical protein
MLCFFPRPSPSVSLRPSDLMNLQVRLGFGHAVGMIRGPFFHGEGAYEPDSRYGNWVCTAVRCVHFVAFTVGPFTSEAEFLAFDPSNPRAGNTNGNGEALHVYISQVNFFCSAVCNLLEDFSAATKMQGQERRAARTAGAAQEVAVAAAADGIPRANVNDNVHA